VHHGNAARIAIHLRRQTRRQRCDRKQTRSS
jgi:hypothetical protein